MLFAGTAAFQTRAVLAGVTLSRKDHLMIVHPKMMHLRIDHIIFGELIDFYLSLNTFKNVELRPLVKICLAHN